MTSSTIPPSSSSTQEYFALPTAQRREAAGERVVEERAGVGALDEELGHVRDVEQAGGRADGVVLGEVRAVADGHRPAAEVGERRAERLVALAQRAW